MGGGSSYPSYAAEMMKVVREVGVVAVERSGKVSGGEAGWTMVEEEVVRRVVMKGQRL